MELWERDGPGIDEMRERGEDWATIGKMFDCSGTAARKRHAMWREKRELSYTPVPRDPEIEGHTAEDETEIDEEAVWRRALKLQEATQKRKETAQKNSFEWTHGPIAIVTMADLHLGGWGVDYARLDNDISMILGTPGMYIVLVGDLLDNFIVGRLKDIRINNAPFSVTEEWALVKRVLKKMSPKLIASCSGNHDLWTFAVSGIDYLAEVHSRLNDRILYHKYDLRFLTSVGEIERRWRVRHSWKGRSQYNPLHGVTKASKFDKGVEWDIGVGAHTHSSGLFTEFNNGGKTGYAVQCGSYKIEDTHAQKLGFPESNESAAVVTFLHDDGWVHGTNRLESACKFMKMYYDNS